MSAGSNSTQSTRPDNARAGNNALYRAVWRWHFYAGLLVIPFMIMLAITGGIYLFHDEISAWMYRDWNTVTPAHTEMLPASVLVARGAAVMPAEVVGIKLPATPHSAARVISSTTPGRRFTGQRFTGYINPYTRAC